METLSVWMVLLPLVLLLGAVEALPRQFAMQHVRRARFISIASSAAGIVLTNLLPQAAYQRISVAAPDAIRLVPVAQFDWNLLSSTWLPDQLLVGAAFSLAIGLFFPIAPRTTALIALATSAGLELTQAWANMAGLTPPFRIDIHDVLIRALGIALSMITVQSLRRGLIARELQKSPTHAPVIHAPAQAPAAVLMIRPAAFQPNPETAADNAFQSAGVSGVAERQSVAAQAKIEVAAVATALRGEGVGVVMFDDREGIDTPDSVFPNNWISTHDDGRVVLYPMAAPSRRRERRGDVVDGLRERYTVSQVLDLSPVELEGRYLEGTGALVLDHVHRIAYMARSGRANEAVLDQWCEAMGYTAEVFDTVDQAGRPIYHTNVVLSIATDFVVAGLNNIPDPAERARIAARLGETGRDVIEIDRRQVAEFAGNGLELTGSRGRIFALSTRALAALRPDQIAAIETSARTLAIGIPTIERSGGSVRCMLAGIHLPPRHHDAPTPPAA